MLHVASLLGVLLGAGLLYVRFQCWSDHNLRTDRRPADPRPRRLPHLLPSPRQVPRPSHRQAHRHLPALPRLPRRPAPRVLAPTPKVRQGRALRPQLHLLQLQHRPQGGLRLPLQRPQGRVLRCLCPPRCQHPQHPRQAGSRPQTPRAIPGLLRQCYARHRALYSAECEVVL